MNITSEDLKAAYDKAVEGMTETNGIWSMDASAVKQNIGIIELPKSGRKAMVSIIVDADKSNWP